MQNAIQWEIEKRNWLIDRLFSHRSSCQTLPVDGTSAVYIRTGCHISLLGAIAGATLYARSKTLPAASHARHLQCLPSAAQWLHVLRGEFPRTRTIVKEKWYLNPVLFSDSFRFQHLMAGWLNYYNLKCQPVDYSDGPMSKRVRVLTTFTQFEVPQG